MKILAKPFALAALALTAAPMMASPAAAQVVRGIGIANPAAILVNSNAYKQAEEQRKTTYKAQLDQAEARRQQIAAQLQPLVTKLQNDARAANPNQQSLQQQQLQIQQLERSGQAELSRMLEQVVLSRAYTNEQIEKQLAPAMEAAAKRKNITLVLDSSQGGVIYADQPYNLNQDILNELNRMVPSVQIVPPAGWAPGGAEQAQQPAATQGR